MIEVIEQDGEIFDLRASSSSVEVRVIPRISSIGDDLILSGLHIQGTGPGSVSLAGLRRFARELGRLRGARRVIIEGGKRTSGAAPGHNPRPVIIEVERGKP